jgi:hypothetical protein
MNRGSDSVTGVYSDARAEYTKQLSVFLVPAYFQFFFQLLEKAKAATTAEPKKFLWQFQTYLNEIPDWNMEKVSTEISTLQGNCGCDYLEDLLTAVFIAHTKVLTAIRVNSKQKKVQITVPKVEHFLFKVLCECSKLLWGSTYLFRDGISSIEKQQNYRNVEGLLNEGIGQAIRALVPVKSLLRDFVAMDDGDDEDEKEETEVSAAAAPAAAQAGAGMTEAAAAPLGSEAPVVTEAAAVAATEESVAPLAEAAAVAVPLAEETTAVAAPLAEAVQPMAEVTGGSDVPPRIVVDTSVHFTDFDTVFDDNPDKSNLVYEPKDKHGSEAPSTGDILEGEAMPLGDEDLDSLEGDEDETATIGDEATDLNEGEYDVLV